jgi:hypothetical protein
VHDAVHGGDAWCESAVAAGGMDNGSGVARSRTMAVARLAHFLTVIIAFLCEYMFMMFVLVTCLSVVYSSNRICMNLTLIIYASLKYKTMSKMDQIQDSTVEYANS